MLLPRPQFRIALGAAGLKAAVGVYASDRAGDWINFARSGAVIVIIGALVTAWDSLRARNQSRPGGDADSGAVIDAFGAALRQKVTIRDGAEQSNFYDYPLLRIEEAPRVTVSIVEIGSPLGGVGEPGVPPSRARSCQCALRSHPATGSEPPVLRSRIGASFDGACESEPRR